MPQRFLTSYPSRLQSGGTSLLTPNLATLKHAETQAAERQSQSRPRPSYKDRESGSPDVTTLTNGRDDSSQRNEPEVDDRGFVTYAEQLDPDSDKAVGKFRYRQPGWVRLRSDYVLEQCCHAEENLIPIRLDLEVSNEYKLKDVFLWNLNEELITPTEFAINLVTDLNLPTHFIAEIARDIRKQLAEYAPVATSILPFAKTVDSVARTAPVIVEVEVHLSRHLLSDKFQWDLCNDVAIEDFVRQTCHDIGLFGEFGVALSCAIREQLMKLKKEVIESPHGLAGLQDIPNECAYDEPAGLRVCPETLGLDWVPNIEILSREEIEKRDGERDRVVRRLRRDTSRFQNASTTGTPTALPQTARKRGRPMRDDRSRAQSPDQMQELDRHRWKCANCRVSGIDIWDLKTGQELCRFCAPISLEVAINSAQLPPDQADIQRQEDKSKWRRNLFSTRHLINNQQWSGR